MNTQFRLPLEDYTWKTTADSPEITIRNQIDYILINIRFKLRNAITSVKTCPGADIRFDHNLVAKMQIFFNIIPKTKQ